MCCLEGHIWAKIQRPQETLNLEVWRAFMGGEAFLGGGCFACPSSPLSKCLANEVLYKRLGPATGEVVGGDRRHGPNSLGTLGVV